MDAIRQALLHTPWWVFALFLFVMSRGVLALKTRTVALSRLAIIPVVFAAWGAFSLFGVFGADPRAVAIFAAALLIGAGLGWVLSQFGAVRADRERGLLEISGSPVTLILILVIFSGRYALGYWAAVDPGARGAFEFLAVSAILSGLGTGVFAGRFGGLRRRYAAAPPLSTGVGG